MLIGISDPLGAKADRLRCEVFQNLILIPINTGTLRHAVATALTVYGIETVLYPTALREIKLQQPLPFTVLKLNLEQQFRFLFRLQQPLPFTVLKLVTRTGNFAFLIVATALTVYGIETKLPLK